MITSVSPMAALLVISTLALAGPQEIGATARGDDETLLATYQETIRPILSQYCFDCHGPEEQKGSVQLDDLNPDFVEGFDAEEWHFALDMIQGAEMPPSKAKQLTDDERRALVGWIEDGLAAAKRASAGPPSGQSRSLPPLPRMMIS